MTIEFHCEYCEKVLRTSDDKAGRQAKCPGCGEAVTVPVAERPLIEPFGESSASGGADNLQDHFGGSPWNRDTPAADRAAAAPATGSKGCPVCGENIRAAAIRCRYCGEDIGGPLAAAETNGWRRPHRGALILTFGVIALAGVFVCQLPALFGIPAWIMGNQDLREISLGVMDPSGEGMARAGKICGIIALVIFGLFVLAICAMIALPMMAAGL